MENDRRDARRILALDLGETCGFAVGQWGAMASGTWNLKPRRKGDVASVGILLTKLDELQRAFPADTILIRLPRKARGRTSEQKHHEIAESVAQWSRDNTAALETVADGQVRKAFTGNGNAAAERMIEECEHRGFMPSHSSEATAIALLDQAFAGFHTDPASILQA